MATSKSMFTSSLLKSITDRNNDCEELSNDFSDVLDYFFGHLNDSHGRPLRIVNITDAHKSRSSRLIGTINGHKWTVGLFIIKRFFVTPGRDDPQARSDMTALLEYMKVIDRQNTTQMLSCVAMLRMWRRETSAPAPRVRRSTFDQVNTHQLPQQSSIPISSIPILSIPISSIPILPLMPSSSSSDDRCLMIQSQRTTTGKRIGFEFKTDDDSADADQNNKNKVEENGGIVVKSNTTSFDDFITSPANYIISKRSTPNNSSRAIVSSISSSSINTKPISNKADARAAKSSSTPSQSSVVVSPHYEPIYDDDGDECKDGKDHNAECNSTSYTGNVNPCYAAAHAALDLITPYNNANVEQRRSIREQVQPLIPSYVDLRDYIPRWLYARLIAELMNVNDIIQVHQRSKMITFMFRLLDDRGATPYEYISAMTIFRTMARASLLDESVRDMLICKGDVHIIVLRFIRHDDPFVQSAALKCCYELLHHAAHRKSLVLSGLMTNDCLGRFINDDRINKRGDRTLVEQLLELIFVHSKSMKMVKIKFDPHHRFVDVVDMFIRMMTMTKVEGEANMIPFYAAIHAVTYLPVVACLDITSSSPQRIISLISHVTGILLVDYRYTMRHRDSILADMFRFLSELLKRTAAPTSSSRPTSTLTSTSRPVTSSTLSMSTATPTAPSRPASSSSSSSSSTNVELVGYMVEAMIKGPRLNRIEACARLDSLSHHRFADADVLLTKYVLHPTYIHDARMGSQERKARLNARKEEEKQKEKEMITRATTTKQ